MSRSDGLALVCPRKVERRSRSAHLKTMGLMMFEWQLGKLVRGLEESGNCSLSMVAMFLLNDNRVVRFWGIESRASSYL